MSKFYNYDTRGASLSDQIIWLEDRVKELEAQIAEAKSQSTVTPAMSLKGIIDN